MNLFYNSLQLSRLEKGQKSEMPSIATTMLSAHEVELLVNEETTEVVLDSKRMNMIIEEIQTMEEALPYSPQPDNSSGSQQPVHKEK